MKPKEQCHLMDGSKGNSEKSSNHSSYLSFIEEGCPQPISRCKFRRFGFLCVLILSGILAITAFLRFDRTNPPKQEDSDESGYLEFLSHNNQSNRTYFYRLEKQDQQNAVLNKRCLILWINGGLGTSSHLGYFSSVGRWIYDEISGGFVLNQHRWSSLCDLLVVDQPMSTGMSTRKRPSNPQPPSEEDLPKTYEELSQDLRLFLVKFMKTRSYTDLHITGESLAGKILLRLSDYYQSHNTDTAGLPRLRSVFMISPWIDAPGHYRTSLDFAVDSGMLSREHADTLKDTQQQCIQGISQPSVSLQDVKRCFRFYDKVLELSHSQQESESSPDKYNIVYASSNNPYNTLKQKVEAKMRAEHGVFNLSNSRVANMFGIENHRDDSEWYAKLLCDTDKYNGLANVRVDRPQLRVLFGGKDFISNYKGGVHAVRNVLSDTQGRGLEATSQNRWEGMQGKVKVYVAPDKGHFACFQNTHMCFEILRELTTS